ncbi:protein mab-21-like [Stylophora pistillata]|nr:protein mab-21-like [Stylophora pistillata]
MATHQPQSRHFDNKYLRSFYQEAEFDWKHKEVKEIERRITSFVQKISDYIGGEDPLFQNTVIPSGSYFEGLKAVGPDEFDFMICLTELSEPGVCVIKDIERKVPDPGYVDVQIEHEEVSERWKQYISRRKNLKSDALLNRFKDLIEEAVKKKKHHLRGYIDENIEIELRKIPVTIKLTWKGKKYSNYEICLDLPLCIKGPNFWPEKSDIPTRLKDSSHPGYKVFKKAVRAGFHLVASTIGESGKHRPCWRLSFSVAEGIVLKNICRNPSFIHKTALKVLKVLRKKHESGLCLYEDPDDPGVSYKIQWVFHSYVLKTMFLHEWCEFPDDLFWGSDQLGERVQGILKRIRSSLKSKDIRSFWVPDYKLFNFRARKPTQTNICVQNLTSLIQNFTI